jgi:hypothetical protein
MGGQGGLQWPGVDALGHWALGFKALRASLSLLLTRRSLDSLKTFHVSVSFHDSFKEARLPNPQSDNTL